MRKIKKILQLFISEKSLVFLQAFIFSRNLNRLAYIFGTDKLGRHQYTPIYSFFFLPLRKRKVKLLEIGVGGYNNPNAGAASLKMWKKFFVNGQIFGIDIYDKTKFEEK